MRMKEEGQEEGEDEGEDEGSFPPAVLPPPPPRCLEAAWEGKVEAKEADGTKECEVGRWLTAVGMVCMSESWWETV